MRAISLIGVNPFAPLAEVARQAATPIVHLLRNETISSAQATDVPNVGAYGVGKRQHFLCDGRRRDNDASNRHSSRAPSYRR